MIGLDKGSRLPDIPRIRHNVVSALKEGVRYTGSDALRRSSHDYRFRFAYQVSLLGCRFQMRNSNSVVARYPR
jgi:hypothetical protein